MKVPASRLGTLAVPAFRAVANLEALSWVGLLTGMAFEYVFTARAEFGEALVSVFGALHGGLVIAFVALALRLAWQLGWRWRLLAFAVAATIPPFATVVFDLWAHRTGRYAPRG